VGDALSEAEYLYLFPAILLLASVFVMRTIRWQLLFYPLKGLSFYNLFGCMTVAYLVNNTVPFQLGDIARAMLLGQLEGVRKSRSLSTVLVERMLDVLFLALLLVLLVPFIDVPSWVAIPAAILGVGFLCIGGLLLAAALRRGWVVALVEKLPEFLPQRVRAKAKDSVHSAIDGLSVLRNPLVLAQVIAWTVVQWIASAAALYLVMLAFNLDVGFDAALFVMVVVSFGFMIPSSPGSIGVYHYLSKRALVGVYAVPAHAALSYAFVAHLLYYVPPIIIGLAFLWHQHLSWQKLRLITRTQEEAIENEEPAESGATAPS
jgi:hypothetical protein